MDCFGKLGIGQYVHFTFASLDVIDNFLTTFFTFLSSLWALSATIGQFGRAKASIDWIGVVHVKSICGSGSLGTLDLWWKVDGIPGPDSSCM